MGSTGRTGRKAIQTTPLRKSPVQRRATLADVARECGLDKSTISKALNMPAAEFALAESTRQRIMESVRRLGYRPSRRAQALARGETRVIGLVYHQATPPSGVYTSVQYALSRILGLSGYTLQFFNIGEDPHRWSEMLYGQQIDGVVAISALPRAFGDMLVESRLPAVLMNLDLDVPVDHVMMDDAAGAELATRHLLELGHRRIAFFGDAKNDPACRVHFSYFVRLRAYEAVMQAAGLEPYELYGKEGTSRLVDELIARGTTAVVAFSHITAIHLLHVAWQRGLAVPGDLSVVSFNEEFPVAVTIPPLTTVTTVGPEMGRVAADLLLRRIKEWKAAAESDASVEVAASQRVVLPEQLIVRGSTAPARKT